MKKITTVYLDRDVLQKINERTKDRPKISQILNTLLFEYAESLEANTDKKILLLKIEQLQNKIEQLQTDMDKHKAKLLGYQKQVETIETAEEETKLKLAEEQKKREDEAKQCLICGQYFINDRITKALNGRFAHNMCVLDLPREKRIEQYGA